MKQDRQGVRTASDVERKYQFGKQFSEIMGIASDARNTSEELGSSVGEMKEQISSLTRTSEEIVAKVEETEDSVESLNKRTTTLEQTSGGFSVTVTEIEEKLDKKADQSTVDDWGERTTDLEQKSSEQESAISDIEESVGKKADQSAVDELGDRTTQLEEKSSELEQTAAELDESLTNKADQSTLEETTNALQGTLSHVQNGLDNKADQSEVNNLSVRTTQLVATAEGLVISVGNAEGQANANKEAIDEISKHFLFDEDGLTIYDSSDGMGIIVSEEKVEFIGGTNPTTSITPNEMETTRLVVGERMDLGKFAYLPRSNGNLSFRYTGG